MAAKRSWIQRFLDGLVSTTAPTRTSAGALERSTARDLTIAVPMVRQAGGLYVCHNALGQVFVALPEHILHGWHRIPFRDRPPEVKRRSTNFIPRDQLTDEQREWLDVDTALTNQVRDQELRSPLRLQGFEALEEEDWPVRVTPAQRDFRIRHDRLEEQLRLRDLTQGGIPLRPPPRGSARNHFPMRTLEEILGMRIGVRRCATGKDGIQYVTLDDGSVFRVAPEPKTEATAQPIPKIPLPFTTKPKGPVTPNVVNAFAVEEALTRALLMFSNTPVFRAIVPEELRRSARREDFEAKTRKWASHLTRKVLPRYVNFVHALAPKVDESGTVRGVVWADSTVADKGYTVKSGDPTRSLPASILDKNPWLLDPAAFTSDTSRPVYLCTPTRFGLYPEGIVFFTLETGSYRRPEYGSVSRVSPELDHFLHMESREFHQDSGLMRNIVSAYIGFWLDPDIKRSWSEYDPHVFGPETRVKIRQIVYDGWIKESMSSEFYEQFPLGEINGTHFVVVPLKTEGDLRIEGKLMRHCIGGYRPDALRRYYSIREARKVGDKLIPTRSRITFDVSATFPSLHDTSPVMYGRPEIQPPRISPRWEVGSVKGVRNMNNSMWIPVVDAAARLIQVPEVGFSYRRSIK